jgi:hypothetical protein
LKIRTSSLPLFGTNETPSMISPPIFLPIDSSTEPSNNVNLPSNNENNNQKDIMENNKVRLN